jgi:hypothetical protein
MDDNLGFRRLIEYQVGIWRGCHATYGRIVRQRSDPGMLTEQIRNGLDASRARVAPCGDRVEM